MTQADTTQTDTTQADPTRANMTPADPDREVAPGDEPADSHGHWILSYLMGLGFASILTVASFWMVTAHPIWAPALPVALVVLAIAQMGVHLVFFLHVTTGPDNTNNVLALAYGILVVFLIVVGSIWIMDHLNHNMMTMEQMKDMQF